MPHLRLRVASSGIVENICGLAKPLSLLLPRRHCFIPVQLLRSGIFPFSSFPVRIRYLSELDEKDVGMPPWIWQLVREKKDTFGIPFVHNARDSRV